MIFDFSYFNATWNCEWWQIDLQNCYCCVANKIKNRNSYVLMTLKKKKRFKLSHFALFSNWCLEEYFIMQIIVPHNFHVCPFTISHLIFSKLWLRYALLLSYNKFKLFQHHAGIIEWLRALSCLLNFHKMWMELSKFILLK
jgi:hypothetical protein